jgi:hypothetical protein
MKTGGSVQLFQYWNRLRNGRAAPKRTEIEPADIKSLLADTFILERDTRGEAVFRLAGTRLCAIYGRELKGYSFPSLWMPKDQQMVSRLAHSAFLAKSVVVITFEGLSKNRRIGDFELLLLPLDGGEGNPRSLGAVTAVQRPFWLGADPVLESHITSLRVVDPDREPMFLKNRPAVPVPPLVPGDRTLDGHPDPGESGRRIRHLVVFEGGRDG